MDYTSMCQFHTGWSHFWRLLVTVDYDGVLIKLMIIFGIWVIQACANFIWYIRYTVYIWYIPGVLLNWCSLKSFKCFLLVKCFEF